MKHREGQSIIEVVVAIAIGSVIVIGGLGAVSDAVRIGKQANLKYAGAAAGRELMDAVVSVAESNWQSIATLPASTPYYLSTSTSPTTVLAGSETLTISTTTYIRSFMVQPVSRSGGVIVASGGSDDPATKQITVIYQVAGAPTSSLATYVTKTKQRVFVQTDWSFGPGVQGPITTSTYGFSSGSGVDATSTPGSVLLPLP
jgi:type II secretory pathway pseudopilin PulG